VRGDEKRVLSVDIIAHEMIIVFKVVRKEMGVLF
jgi:hypothetical protein